MREDRAAEAAPLERDVRAVLAAADAAIDVRWASLCPEREHARRLIELVPASALPGEVRLAIASGLAAIGRAVRRSFPDNIFCDLDLVLASLERGGARHGRGWVEDTAGTIEALHELFGSGTPIQFRYVHDFLYGFDWARWVRRERAARAGVGPFDPVFLDHARTRGRELQALIATDDPKYHRIARGEHRNPFPFARDPASEAMLLRDLARRGWIPVEAWRADAEPDLDRDHGAERERCARQLGL
jgi:hypothetical protein